MSGTVLEREAHPKGSRPAPAKVSTDALLRALRFGNAGTRARAVELLGLLPPAERGGTGPLTAALRDRDSWVRSLAAQALGRWGDPAAVPALALALRDPDRWVRARASEALGAIGSPTAVGPLLAALQNPDFADSWNADALGRIGDRRAVEPLIHQLRVESGVMRLRCALALGRLADPRAIFPLSQALLDLDPTVREAAAESLCEIAQREPVAELRVALPRLRTLSNHRVTTSPESAELFQQAALLLSDALRSLPWNGPHPEPQLDGEAPYVPLTIADAAYLDATPGAPSHGTPMPLLAAGRLKSLLHHAHSLIVR